MALWAGGRGEGCTPQSAVPTGTSHGVGAELSTQLVCNQSLALCEARYCSGSVIYPENCSFLFCFFFFKYVCLSCGSAYSVGLGCVCNQCIMLSRTHALIHMPVSPVKTEVKLTKYRIIIIIFFFLNERPDPQLMEISISIDDANFHQLSTWPQRFSVYVQKIYKYWHTASLSTFTFSICRSVFRLRDVKLFFS